LTKTEEELRVTKTEEQKVEDKRNLLSSRLRTLFLFLP